MKYREMVTLIFGIAVFGGLAAQSVSIRHDLTKALVFYASFDESTQADFGAGSGELVWEQRDVEDRAPNYVIRPNGGRYGGAIDFFRWSANKVYYKGKGIANYSIKNWSGTLSVWLKISPDEDLLPGWSDPVQIRCDDNLNGFVFLEWSKIHTPRRFRFVVRPQYDLWNPGGVGWAELPDLQKPMVEIEHVPFSNQHWTHVLCTWEKVNQRDAAVARMYIDGELQGTLSGRNLNFAWDDDDLNNMKLALASSYIGQIDDLAVFNRALGEREIAQLRSLDRGVASLLEDLTP